MANVNPTIWGAPETWDYSPHTTYGLTSLLSQTIHADRPKVAHFGGTTPAYTGSLLQAINVAQKMTLNEFIDNSICPCGQSPDVSPFAKIAIFNENDDLSTTPRVVTITDNINWFFADKAATAPYNNQFQFFKQYTRQGDPNEGLKYQQFAQKANAPANSYNIDMQMCPYTYYGLRSLFLSIEVHCMPKTATNPITQANWRTLRAWKAQYSEIEDIIGLRLYVRNCQSINPTTLELTYSTDKSISGGQQSFVCITNPITINNDGSDTPTQMLSIYNKGSRCAYIFDITDQISAWFNGTDSRTNRAVLPCWNYFDGQTINFYKPTPTDPEGYYYYKIPYSENTYNKIMSITALFGCFFTDRNVNVFPYDMLSEYAYLPIIDENGVAHGQYTHGADNATNSLYSKNSIREIDYDPNTPPTPTDPNTYSNTTGFNSITAGATATERYVLDTGNTRQLLSDLWTISHNIAGIDYDKYDYKILDSFLVTDPIDCIISLKRFPFNIPHTFSNAKTPVNLGKNHGLAQGYLTYNVFNTVEFAGINIFPRFGNSFLDYAPYTEYELYVPFCGTVKLNAGDILGHTLNCRLQIDLITGACTAYIMADSLVIETLTGIVSCELALTGIDSATIDANIQNSVLNHINARTNKEVSMLSPLTVGGLIGAASNPFRTAGNINTANTDLQRAEYNLTHMQTPPHTMGTAGGLTGWYQEFNARLMIYYPEGDVITDSKPPSLIEEKIKSFGNLNGFSCLKWGKVKDFSGFTLGNIKLDGVPCTESERARLKQLFSTGVYL